MYPNKSNECKDKIVFWKLVGFVVNVSFHHFPNIEAFPTL